MQIGCGHLISPSASSTRDLGTRLGKNDNNFKGTFKMSRTDISGKCKGLFVIWKYQLDFVVYPQMFIFLLRIIFLRARHLQRAKKSNYFDLCPATPVPLRYVYPTHWVNAGIDMEAVFCLGIKVLTQISRSRFKQSKISLLIPQGCFIIFLRSFYGL